ncbi:hypothetical protein P9294_gp115 [Bacillus phage FADO]|uniref:Uncharacterized protein n=1 Tax=Bacillus phage FADO TaxID=2917160 RepID=A0AAE9GC71_9CAUD|nr:hypothetical protein P9294_gp115 [Bacillus phage FADO]UNY48830.1 hypothetical protein fado_115 [Bacillus phage FADO]
MKNVKNMITFVLGLVAVGLIIYFAIDAHSWKEEALTYKKITLDQNDEIDYREKLLGKALNKQAYTVKEANNVVDMLYKYDNKGKSEKEIYAETAEGTESRFDRIDTYKFNKIDDEGNYMFKSITDGSDYMLFPNEVKSAKIKKGDTVQIESNEYGEFVKVTKK